MNASNEMTASQVLVQSLEQQGVERVFCVPGESYLGVLDALHDSSIETVVARQEGGAAMMAEADGKLTGRPGVVFVTRGPGATNASSGIHVAQQDSTPLIMIAGQVERSMRGKDAFQEIDFDSVFGGMAKAVFELESADEVADTMAQAFEIALAGRPGPVVISIPEDVCTETTARHAKAFVAIPDRAVAQQDVDAFDALLNAAERPVVLVGGSTWRDDSVEALRAFATRAGVPLSCVFRRQHLVDHAFAHYIGDFGIGVNPALRRAVEDSDLLVLLGTRFSEIASQSYALPAPGARVVHVHVDANELGKVHAAELMISGDPGDLVGRSVAARDRSAYVRELRAAYEGWSALPTTPTFDMTDVIGLVEAKLAGDAIVTNGAGNYSGWIHRFHRFRHFRDQVAPTSGSMGYGLPAAVAAKLRHPDRDVLCFAGDGCFQMTSQEFGTAMQAGAGVLVLVVDNGMYGTIRMHQERDYPNRVHATSIQNPEFAEIARAYGGFAERVETAEALAGAFDRAIDAARGGRPALLHLVVDPNVISPTPDARPLIEREAGRAAFGAAALDYHAARPPYPAQVFDDALRGREPRDTALLDIGAGNGLAAQGFLDRGVTNVTFVEPDIRFRPFLAARLPAGEIVNATLEEARFSVAFDIAIVGTAWHWLDPETRMAKVAATLRPGGSVVLAWNLFRDDQQRDEFHDATTWIFDALPGQRAAADRPLGALNRGDRFREFALHGGFASMTFDAYRWSISLTTAEMRSLYAGFSPIQRLSAEDRQWTLDQLADVAEREFAGTVVRNMTTACYIGTLRG